MTASPVSVEPTPRTPTPKVTVLCVDDEPLVLEGLSLHLARRYQVFTATSGEKALALLAEHPECAVILSDMRMPGMDGASLLAETCKCAPDATRMLLTGQTDVVSAAAAVNKGQLFRFLTKPCPVPDLLDAFAAAVEQHRLVTAERVLLRETLFGSIQAIAELMAVVAPDSVGRSTRVQRLVTSVATQLGWEERWQVELAALLSQAARATLPGVLLERRDQGDRLEEAERALIDEAPAVAARLVAHVPRIEEVRQILLGLRGSRSAAPSGSPVVRRGIELLRAIEDFVDLESHGDPIEAAIASMQARPGAYAREVLDALCKTQLDHAVHMEVKELAVVALRPGMVVLDDVRLATGVLLLPKGMEVTRSLVERIRYARPGSVRSPVRVQLPKLGATSS